MPPSTIALSTLLRRDATCHSAWVFASCMSVFAALAMQGWWVDRFGQWVEPQDPLRTVAVILGAWLLAGAVIGWRVWRVRAALAGGRGEGWITARHVSKLGATLTARYKAGPLTYDTQHTVRGGPPLPVETRVMVAFPEDSPGSGIILDALQ